MNYILNEQGDVQVRMENGLTKYLPKHIAENSQLMRTYKMEVVSGAVKFETSRTEIVNEIINDAIELNEIIKTEEKSTQKRAYNKKK